MNGVLEIEQHARAGTRIPLVYQHGTATHQIASLFESLGFLVEKGYVKAEIVDDMFATKLAWETTEPFVTGMRKTFAAEDYYFFFERLYNRLSKNETGSITGEYLARVADGKPMG